MNELDINNNNNIFEKIKHVDKNNNEYWYARELGKLLKYGEYRKFLQVIEKAMISCSNSNKSINDYFAQIKDYIMAIQLMILQKEKI